jgi:hypothetical protein
LNTCNPVAGELIANIWVLVIRGYKNPLEVEFTSRAADDCGVVVPIPTCAFAKDNEKIESMRNVFFFVIAVQFLNNDLMNLRHE